MSDKDEDKVPMTIGKEVWSSYDPNGSPIIEQMQDLMTIQIECERNIIKCFDDCKELSEEELQKLRSSQHYITEI